MVTEGETYLLWPSSLSVSFYPLTLHHHFHYNKQKQNRYKHFTRETLINEEYSVFREDIAVSPYFIPKTTIAEKMDLFDNPSLMTVPVDEGEPRIIDTIFNVTGLVSNLFNTSNNALFTYVGGLVLFIVLLGKTFEIS